MRFDCYAEFSKFDLFDQVKASAGDLNVEYPAKDQIKPTKTFGEEKIGRVSSFRPFRARISVVLMSFTLFLLFDRFSSRPLSSFMSLPKRRQVMLTNLSPNSRRSGSR
jgi:hypothetical protein